MNEWDSLLTRIVQDERYLANLDWGRPRRGHPEGTVRAHIHDLERNLQRFASQLTAMEIAKLRVLIHVHDTFKAEAIAGVPIAHPQSHASLARQFLAEFTTDDDLLAMVQSHDEPFALWNQFRQRGACSQQRLQQLRDQIADWRLFSAFLLIDGCTPGKGTGALNWFLSTCRDGLGIPWTLDDLHDLAQSDT